MDAITIHTGLDGFSMVDRITRISVKSISGYKTFINAPSYLCLESLAQMCALHVRHTLNYEKHAFLLKITRCTMNTDLAFSGRHMLQADLQSHSSQAFSYAASLSLDGQHMMDGEFIIAVRAYDGNFTEKILKPHYKKVLSCLHNDTQTN